MLGKIKAVIYVIALCFCLGSVSLALLQEYVFTSDSGVIAQRVENSSAISKVTVDYKLDGKGGQVAVNHLDKDDGVNTAAGSLCNGIDITAKKRNVEKADITFTYNPNKLKGNEESLAIAYYNEAEDRMELLEDSEVDTSEHTVSVTTEHFSKYVVVDSDEWYNSWSQSQMLIRSMSSEQQYFDVMFALDSSGSMNSANKSELSKECTYRFIKYLYGGDYMSVYDFDSNAHLVINKTMQDETISWTALEDRIMAIDANGDTEIDTAIMAALDNFEVAKKNCVNIEVLLTDGQSKVNTDLVDQAAEANIIIITVGFGDDVDEALLKDIAERTGGSYFKADTNNIGNIFDDIRQSYIGVDLSDDADADGIPDVIETSGMRTQYGNFVTTDPNNADTDGDGVGDGVEMGTLVTYDNVTDNDKKHGLDEYVYFKTSSDPTVANENTEYDPKVAVEKTFTVSDNKDSIDYTFDVQNMSQLSEKNKNGNVINAMENAKATVTIPDCCSANDGTEFSSAKVESGKSWQISGTLSHDPEKCSGERHVIGVVVEADNITKLYDEIRVNNIYWFENLADDATDTEQIALIEKVRAYTNTSGDDTDGNSAQNDSDVDNIGTHSTPRQKVEYLKNDSVFISEIARKAFADSTSSGKLEKLSSVTYGSSMLSGYSEQAEAQRYKERLVDYVRNDIDTDAQRMAIVSKAAGDIDTYIQGLLTALDKKDSSWVQTYKSEFDRVNEACKSLLEAKDVGNVEHYASRAFEYINALGELDDGIKSVINSYDKLRLEVELGDNKMLIGTGSIGMLSECIDMEMCYLSYEDVISFMDIVAEGTENTVLKSAATELKTGFEDGQTNAKTAMETYIASFGYDFTADTGENAGIFSSGVYSVINDNTLSKACDTLGEYHGIGDSIDKTTYFVCDAETARIFANYLDTCADEFNAAYIKDMDSAYSAALRYVNFYGYALNFRKKADNSYKDIITDDNAVISDYLKNNPAGSGSVDKDSDAQTVEDKLKVITSYKTQDDDYRSAVNSFVNDSANRLDAIKLS